MDNFVYQCKKRKTNRQNEVPFPKLAAAIMNFTSYGKWKPCCSSHVVDFNQWA